MLSLICRIGDDHLGEGTYTAASEDRIYDMFEHLNTPEEIFSFKLGAALSMEQKLVEVLGELEDHAQRAEIKQALRIGTTA